MHGHSLATALRNQEQESEKQHKEGWRSDEAAKWWQTQSSWVLKTRYYYLLTIKREKST